jgi:hypothetical protein
MTRAALAALAGALAIGALPAPAEAHINKERSRIDGNTAVATWNYQVADVATFVSVVVTDNSTVTNGTSGQDRFATVSILQSNVSTGNVLVAGVADLSEFTLTVDDHLGSAHLQASGLFEDDSTLTFFPITIDLTWTATADAVRQHSHDVFREPGFLVISRFKGLFRDAAVTGSISGNDTEFVFGASESGQIQQNDSGTLTIQINKCGSH